MNVQHVLFPTDLSELSMRPLERCPEIFRDREVTLLTVLRALPISEASAALMPAVDDPTLSSRIAEARARMEEMTVALLDSKDTHIEVIVGGNAGKEAARWAAEHGIDLIALSTHGRTGFRHLAMGSVAETLLRHATVPVMVFPAKEPLEDAE